jgi:uncharacterized protein YjbJ (UPF0337 family)
LGAAEELKGKAKQAAGDLTGNEALQQEGRFQEEKGRAERHAVHERARAKAHEAEAKEKELEQEIADASR